MGENPLLQASGWGSRAISPAPNQRSNEGANASSNQNDAGEDKPDAAAKTTIQHYKPRRGRSRWRGTIQGIKDTRGARANRETCVMNVVSMALKGEPDDHGDEAHQPKIRNAPIGPTEEERELHEATHVPYREWCKFCVRSRGRNRPHKKASEIEKGQVLQMNKVSMDYFFMSQEDEGAGKYPLIAMLDESTRNKYMRAVGMKGFDNQLAALGPDVVGVRASGRTHHVNHLHAVPSPS